MTKKNHGQRVRRPPGRHGSAQGAPFKSGSLDTLTAGSAPQIRSGAGQASRTHAPVQVRLPATPYVPPGSGYDEVLAWCVHTKCHYEDAANSHRPGWTVQMVPASLCIEVACLLRARDWRAAHNEVCATRIERFYFKTYATAHRVLMHPQDMARLPSCDFRSLQAPRDLGLLRRFIHQTRRNYRRMGIAAMRNLWRRHAAVVATTTFSCRVALNPADRIVYVAGGDAWLWPAALEVEYGSL